jgi:phosphate/sulfate permease
VVIIKVSVLSCKYQILDSDGCLYFAVSLKTRFTLGLIVIIFSYVVASWVISPLMAGVISSCFYLALQYFVLKKVCRVRV